MPQAGGRRSCHWPCHWQMPVPERQRQVSSPPGQRGQISRPGSGRAPQPGATGRIRPGPQVDRNSDFYDWARAGPCPGLGPGVRAHWQARPGPVQWPRSASKLGSRSSITGTVMGSPGASPLEGGSQRPGFRQRPPNGGPAGAPRSRSRPGRICFPGSVIIPEGTWRASRVHSDFSGDQIEQTTVTSLSS